jgi:hypothetical protein
MKHNLHNFVSFGECYQFYTAKEVTNFINRYDAEVNVITVGRFLNSNARDRYYSREGKKYLCKLIEEERDKYDLPP